MKESETSFDQLLTGCEKFGVHGRASQDDLPALRDYRQNVVSAINKDLVDAFTTLTTLEPMVETEEDFGNAQTLGYSIKNAMDRVIILAEIAGYVSHSISELEASAKQGGAP